ncbi:MAG: hypothetical protein V2A71_08950 [Candidatus Eisenbacteria bacterium]
MGRRKRESRSGAAKGSSARKDGSRPTAASRHEPVRKRRSFLKRHRRLAERLPDLISCAVIAVAVLVVYYRVLHYFFAQDDFTSLWIANSPPETFWRILSSYVYFGGISALFGFNAVAFHALSLILHVANACMVFFVARRFSSSHAACIFASLFFGVHPSLYAPLISISSAGEILSCSFILAASLYLLNARKPHGLKGILVVSALFAGSLLCKEVTILFPLIVFAAYALRGRRLKEAVPTFVALAFVAAVYAGLFYQANIFGVRVPPEEGAYVLSGGSDLVTCLQTYFKWTFNIVEARAKDPTNLLDPEASSWLAFGAVFFGVVVLAAGKKKVRAFYPTLWYFLMLLPVLPLTGHPYHYYLYIPLAGLAPVLAFYVSRIFRRVRSELPVSLILGLLFLLNSHMIIDRTERASVMGSQRKRDGLFDRPIVAGNLISDLSQIGIPRGAKLLLLSPVEDLKQGRFTEHPFVAAGGYYWDTNLRAAVAEDLGIKLFFPQVDTVAYAEFLGPEHSDFLIIRYTWDGHIRNLPELKQ